MATASRGSGVFYPESDGKPMGETTIHRDVMLDTITALRDWFAADPLAYVSGNEFLYFVEGDPRRNVSPDVWVALGIDKAVVRPSYKTWLEAGKGPDFVLEVSSRSTRREDLKGKFALYRDELRALEYFLFDPLREYLKPPFQGYRLVDGVYEPVEARDGRLPSVVLGLHLEADGDTIRLFDPAVGRRVPTRLELIEQEKSQRLLVEAEVRRKDEAIRQQGEAIRQQGEAFRQRDEAFRQSEAIARQRDEAFRQSEAIARQRDEAFRQAEAIARQRDEALNLIAVEMDRLRRELEALRAAGTAGGRARKPKPKRE